MKKKAVAGKLGLRRHLIVLDNRHLDNNNDDLSTSGDKALYFILKPAIRVHMYFVSWSSQVSQSDLLGPGHVSLNYQVYRWGRLHTGWASNYNMKPDPFRLLHRDPEKISDLPWVGHGWNSTPAQTLRPVPLATAPVFLSHFMSKFIPKSQVQLLS